MYKEKFETLCRASDKLRETNDCSVKALAIVCRINYKTAHTALAAQGRKTGRGTYSERVNVDGSPRVFMDQKENCNSSPQMTKAGEKLGFKFTAVPASKWSNNGRTGTVSGIARNLTRGYYLVFIRGHVLAAHNGEIHDWTAGRKHHVKGIWKVEKS